MSQLQHVFPVEARIEELYDTVYPIEGHQRIIHPSRRGAKPIFGTALGSMVPGDDDRLLQRRRQYYRVDFQDFLEYATSCDPVQARLTMIPNHTAIIYDSLESSASNRQVVASYSFGNTRLGISILDALVARDEMFITVIMRFAPLTLRTDASSREEKHSFGSTLNFQHGQIAECGATITFAPDHLEREADAGSLLEWDRAYWLPPLDDDREWRFNVSGVYTNSLLDELELTPEQKLLSQEAISAIREQGNDNHKANGVYFEIARLGLSLPSYIDFMYDLVVTERQRVGFRAKPTAGKRVRRKRKLGRPVYKIIKSIRIIRPNALIQHTQTFKNWTAPSYGFFVRGHWRHYEESTKKGRDAEGNIVSGKTWVRQYEKYTDRGEVATDGERRTRNPEVTIGIKQTISYARDVIESYERSTEIDRDVEKIQGPTSEWMATERAKLSAGLRYAILKRDGFRCILCGKDASSENYVKLEVDHIIPVSRWGRTVESNLRSICRDCNRGKSSS
jgi:hypothetical protein